MGIWDAVKHVADTVSGPIYDEKKKAKPGTTRATRTPRQQAMVDASKRQHPEEGDQIADLGAIGRGTAQEAVDYMIGGERARKMELERTGMSITGAQDVRNYDTSHLRRGDLTPDQMAQMYVFQGSNEPNQWYDRNGKLTSSTRERALELDRNIQSILQLQPELADPTMSNALMSIAMEPFLEDRLQGMAKGQTWLQMRGLGLKLMDMPDEHEAIYFDNLLPQQQAALEQAGYVPVPERPKVETGGLHNLAPGWGRLGTAGEYLGIDSVYDQTQDLADDTVGKVGRGIFKGFDLAQNTVNTTYRTVDKWAHDGDQGLNFFQSWGQAWEGETYFYEDAKKRALDLAGTQANYNMMVRLANGEAIDDIATDYADMGTTEYAEKWQEIQSFASHPNTQAGVEALTRGKISFGRMVATDVLQLDPETSGALYQASSGTFDLAWQLLADPTIIGGRLIKMGRMGATGLASTVGEIGSAQRRADQLERLARLTSSAEATTLADHVRAMRGGVDYVAEVSAPGYWSDLAKMPGLDTAQRDMVALSDHMHAFAQGNDQALFAFGRARPNREKMLLTFQNYVEKTNTLLPSGVREDVVDLGTVSRFMNTAPGQQLLDDVVDMGKDSSGLFALMAGRATSVTDQGAAIPRLTRAGAYRLETKMAMERGMNWLEKWGVDQLPAHRWRTEDIDNSAALVASTSESLRTGANLSLDDELHTLRQALDAEGFDATTVERTINREVLRMLNIEIKGGETPAHAIMRSMVTASEGTSVGDIDAEQMLIRHVWQQRMAGVQDENVLAAMTNKMESDVALLAGGEEGGRELSHAEVIRNVWQTRIAMDLGPDVARDWMNTSMRRYLDALGINHADDEFRVYRNVADLTDAVEMGVIATDDAGVAVARRAYAKALMNRHLGAEDTQAREVLGMAEAGGPLPQQQIDDALEAYDHLVSQGRLARENEPVDAVADASNRLNSMIKIPLAHAAVGASTFAHRLLEGVPTTPYLALNDMTTPRTLQQLLAYNIRGEKAGTLYDAFMRAGEGGRRAVVRDIYTEMFGRAGILRDERYGDFVAEWMNASTQRYARHDMFSGPDGMVHVGHLPDSHYASHVAIPSFRELHANMKRAAFLDLIWGYGHKYLGINSDLATRFMNAWRASVVLRPAMIPRAGGEEFFAQTMRWGFGYAARQGVLGRLHSVDKAVMARKGLNDALHVDANVGMFGSAWRKADNAVEAFGNHILESIEPGVRLAMGDEAAHAMSMSKLSPVARRGQAAISGTDAGIAPMAKLGLGDDLRGPFSLDIRNVKTGELDTLEMKPSKVWSQVSEHDAFYRNYLSQHFQHWNHDEFGRAGVAELNGYIHPDTAAAVAPVLGEQLRFINDVEGESPDVAAVITAREAFGTMAEDDLAVLEDWVWTHKDLTKAPPIDIDMSDKGFDHLVQYFDWDRAEAPQRLEDLVRSLGYNDFHSLLASPEGAFPRPMGHLDQLTVEGDMYRGTHLSGENDLLFNGQTDYHDLEDTFNPAAHSGPGVYITASGPYAERYVHPGAPSHDPMVTRLRFRDGEQPKLIPYMDTDLAPEMNGQLQAAMYDMIGEIVDPVYAPILQEIYSEGYSAEEAAWMIEDLDLGPDLHDELVALVSDHRFPTKTPQTYNTGATPAVHNELNAHYEQWSRFHNAVREAGVRAPQADELTIFNKAYGEHVVDHFGAQGYRGISDHQPRTFYNQVDTSGANNTNVLSAAYWYPEDLTVAGEIPWRDSVANAILSERATASDIGWGTSDLDKVKDNMARRMRATAWRPDRQYKLNRMDHTAIGDDIPAGHVRVQVPIIPEVVARAIQDTMAESGGFMPAGVHNSGLSTLGGVGDDLQRASLVTRYTDPGMRAHLERVLDRIDAMGDHPQALAAHLATTDPDTAEAVLKRLKDGLRGLKGKEAQVTLAELQGGLGPTITDELIDLVHMGTLDLKRTEWDGLELAAGKAATIRTPEEVQAAVNAMPTEGRGAYDEVRQSLGDTAEPLRPDGPVSWGGPVRYVNNNVVLAKAKSAPVDDLKWRAVDLSDGDRAQMLNVLESSHAKTREAIMARANGQPPPRPISPRSDWDIVQQIKSLRARGIVKDTDLPEGLLPYLEAPVPGTEPTTLWAIQPGNTTYDGVNNMIDQAVGDAMDTFVGKDGKVLYGVTHPVAKGKYTYEKNFFGREVGQLPDATVGPVLQPPPAELGRMSKGVDWGMDKIGRGISWMSRNPLWREEFGKSYTAARQVFEATMVDASVAAHGRATLTDAHAAANMLFEHTEIVRDADKGWMLDDHDVLSLLAEKGYYEPKSPLRYLVPKDGKYATELRTEFDGTEKRLLNWYRQNQVANDTAVQAASERATTATVPFIDDHKVRSQWAEMVHNVIPFWFAEEQFYKRWGKTFIQSPESLRRMQLTHHAMNSAGFTKKNEYGEEVFVYPYADHVAGALAKVMELLPTDTKWTLPIQAQMTGQLMYAAPGFDRIGVPSAGPMVAIPLRVLRAVRPELAMPIEERLLGQRGVGRSLPEQVLPSFAYRMFNFATASDEDLTANTIGAMVMLEANHPDWVPGPDASAVEVDTYFERLRNHARIMQATKAILGFGLPASPAYDFDPNDLSTEFRSYLAAGVPIEEASANFLRDHPDATPYTIFNTETPSKAPTDPTEAVYSEILGNEDFYTQHRAASWLLPAGEPTDPFDRQAWYELLANKIRTRKSAETFYTDLKFAEAADQYFSDKKATDEAIAAAPSGPERDRIRALWKQHKDEYFSAHRIFAENIQNPGSHNDRVAVITDMAESIDDDRAPDVPQAHLIREMLHGYADFQANMAANAGSSNKDEKHRKLLRHSYLEWAEQYSQAHPTAHLFFRRILLPEIDTTGGYRAELEDTDVQQGAA